MFPSHDPRGLIAYKLRVTTNTHNENKEAFTLKHILCVETDHNWNHPEIIARGIKNGIQPTSDHNAKGVKKALHNPKVISVGWESLYFQIWNKFLNILIYIFDKDMKKILRKPVQRVTPSHNYLKYWRIIRYWAKAKYGFSVSDLDMMLFLYSENFFSKKTFYEYTEMMSWIKAALIS